VGLEVSSGRPVGHPLGEEKVSTAAIRESINGHLAAIKQRHGEGTRRNEDRRRELESEYSNAQHGIVELDRQIRMHSGARNSALLRSA
jgi:hypothetical protein